MPASYSQLSLINKRTEFAGRTDKYSPMYLRPGGSISVVDAINGVGPFDVFGGTLFNKDMRNTAINRMNRYREQWKFYKGEHFVNPYDDGERKVVFNFCKAIVDKGVQWFVANGWKVTSPTGNDQVANLLNVVWEGNNRDWLTQKAAQFASVTGDSFYFVSVETADAYGNLLPPDKHKVKISCIDPAYCFPVFSDDGSYTMRAMLVQYPVVDADTGNVALYSLYITPDEWVTFMNDKEVDRQPNFFGKINVVHVPNFYRADSLFGDSDIEHIIQINEEYNTVANSVRRIIKYHAEPTTLIYGARASNLERSSKKVWSNLPTDAKVENLQLESDLTANYAYLKMLEAKIEQMSDIPAIAFDSSDLKISNTSGLAMQMMFQPLIEKTKRRRISHLKGIQEVNELIITAMEVVFRTDVKVLADDTDSYRRTAASYTLPLPRDEKTEVDLAVQKVEAGIWSKAEAVRQLSGVSDIERLAVELVADERMELAMSYETQRAQTGQVPNLTAPFLGSLPLSEDLTALAKKSEGTEKKAAEAVKPTPVE